jgi:aminopeptidase S
VTSARITLTPRTGQKLQFRYTFAHDVRSSSADRFAVEVLDVDTASATPVFTVTGAPVERNASWKSASIDLSAFAGRTIRLRFSATDGGVGGIVEAAFDDVRVTQPQ